MILLDTNVVSELVKPEPSTAVQRWMQSQQDSELYLSVVTEAELRSGLARAPEGRRRRELMTWLDALLQRFQSRILTVDRDVAIAFAEVTRARFSAGRPIDFADGLIAATGLAHGAILVTRNVADLEGCGVPLINPFED
jgi:hypothetical protein